MERQKKWSRFCLQCGIVEAKYEWQRHSVLWILYWNLLPTIQPRYQLLGRLTTRISAITISIIHLRLVSCWWSCTSWPWWAWSAAASATAAASRGTCTWRSGHGLCWDNLGTWDWNYFIVLWCTSTVICLVAGLKIINHWNLGLEVCGYYRTHGQI